MFRTNNWSSSSGVPYSSLQNFTVHLKSSLVADTTPIKKLKWSRYRPGVAQRVGRSIALLFHDRGTRRGWVVSSTPQPHFTTGKDPVPILQEAGWAPGSVWTGADNLVPTGIRSPDRPARSQSLYRLSYPAHGTIRMIRQKILLQNITFEGDRQSLELKF